MLQFGSAWLCTPPARIRKDIRPPTPDLVADAGNEALPPAPSQERRCRGEMRACLNERDRGKAARSVETKLQRDGFEQWIKVETVCLFPAHRPLGWGCVREKHLHKRSSKQETSCTSGLKTIIVGPARRYSSTAAVILALQHPRNSLRQGKPESASLRFGPPTQMSNKFRTSPPEKTCESRRLRHQTETGTPAEFQIPLTQHLRVNYSPDSQF